MSGRAVLPLPEPRPGGGGAAAVRFCGHCGRRPEGEPPPTRVCSRCGLGLLLEAPSDVAPAPDDPFLVVDSRLSVCAVSRRAEELLATQETEAVNRHVTEFLVPADAEAPSAENLLAQLVDAAGGEHGPRTVVVRPAGVYGVRYWARVGRCGPPSAALVVLAA